jgi:hypothetical protein
MIQERMPWQVESVWRKRTSTLILLCLPMLLSECATVFRPDEYDDAYMKGMNIFFMSSRNRYRAREYDSTLSTLSALGINTAFLVTHHYSADEHSDTLFATDETVPESTLRRIIEHTRSKGIEPVLKPHVNLLNGTSRYKLRPKNPSRWIEAYRKILVRYASLSQEYGLSRFVVGTELDGVADLSEFHNLISNNIREAFDGQILYAASFDHCIASSIWEVVDAIGVNAYFNLCKSDDCTEYALTRSWNYWLNVLDRMAISHGKPLFITEIGYYSRKGCAINPGDWRRGGEIDFGQQARAYEALLCQAGGFENVQGISWWQWELNNAWGSDSADYTPEGKPAQDVIRKYWGHES